jgi:hypothetical protein
MTELSPEELEAVARGFMAFETHTATRHEMGAEKYGEGTFLGKDILQMTLDELADAANYLRYFYTEIYIKREQLKAAGLLGDLTIANPKAGKELLGKESVFNPYSKD